MENEFFNFRTGSALLTIEDFVAKNKSTKLPETIIRHKLLFVTDIFVSNNKTCVEFLSGEKVYQWDIDPTNFNSQLEKISPLDKPKYSMDQMEQWLFDKCFERNLIGLLNFSIPVHETFDFDELKLTGGKRKSKFAQKTLHAHNLILPLGFRIDSYRQLVIFDFIAGGKAYWISLKHLYLKSNKTKISIGNLVNMLDLDLKINDSTDNEKQN